MTNQSLPKDLKGTPVLIVWDDAHADLEAHKGDQEYEPCITYSVGIMVRKRKEGIVIYSDYVPSHKDYRVRGSIPSGMIKSVIKLVPENYD